MRLTIILAGGTIITAAFALWLFWSVYLPRHDALLSLKPPVNDTTREVVIKDDNSPKARQSKRAIGADTYAQNRLLRGELVGYDSATQTVSFIAERYDVQGAIQSDLVEISTTPISEVLCWPETATFGDQTITLREAYFPLTPQSRMYLEGEEVRLLGNVLPRLMPKTYVMVLLDETTISAASLSPTALPAELIPKQIIVLGCPK